MNYYLKIQGTEFPNVSELEIDAEYRMENVQQSLTGDLLIDRLADEKITLTAKINMLSDAEMTALRQAKKAIFCEITFDRGLNRETHTMHILDFTEPAPIYYFGDKDKGMIYGSVKIEAEER